MSQWRLILCFFSLSLNFSCLELHLNLVLSPLSPRFVVVLYISVSPSIFHAVFLGQVSPTYSALLLSSLHCLILCCLCAIVYTVDFHECLFERHSMWMPLITHVSLFQQWNILAQAALVLFSWHVPAECDCKQSVSVRVAWKASPSVTACARADSWEPKIRTRVRSRSPQRLAYWTWKEKKNNSHRDRGWRAPSRQHLIFHALGLRDHNISKCIIPHITNWTTCKKKTMYLSPWKFVGHCIYEQWWATVSLGQYFFHGSSFKMLTHTFHIFFILRQTNPSTQNIGKHETNMHTPHLGFMVGWHQNSVSIQASEACAACIRSDYYCIKMMKRRFLKCMATF